MTRSPARPPTAATPSSSPTDGVREPVEAEGLIYKFPFATEKKDYDFWDGDVGEAVSAVYDGKDIVEGLDVYRFVQTIPETSVGTREVPGSLVGSDEASVDADEFYENTRTFYVEPETGAVVNRIDDGLSTLSLDGQTVTLERLYGALHRRADQRPRRRGRHQDRCCSVVRACCSRCWP